MKWNWDSQSWKRSNKILLGIVTVWPFMYLGLFIVGMFSLFLILPFAERKQEARNCGNVDLLQLDHKIRNGDIKQLTVKPRELVVVDRVGECEFTVAVTNQSTRDEILRAAREVVNGQPRVEKIVETDSDRENVPTLLPVGFFALFAMHGFTMLLMMALMPIYIILAVKNEGLDQTMRIVWVVLFATLGILVNPVYWYLYIWKKRPGLNNPVAPPPAVDIPSVS